MNDECIDTITVTEHTQTHTHKHTSCLLLLPHLQSFTHSIIRNAIVVIIIVASISNPVLIVIFLSRVGEVGAVVLGNSQHS